MQFETVGWKRYVAMKPLRSEPDRRLTRSSRSDGARRQRLAWAGGERPAVSKATAV